MKTLMLTAEKRMFVDHAGAEIAEISDLVR
jgi:hypothetical protein